MRYPLHLGVNYLLYPLYMLDLLQGFWSHTCGTVRDMFYEIVTRDTRQVYTTKKKKNFTLICTPHRKGVSSSKLVDLLVGI